MEVILSGMSNETVALNTELEPISASADRLLGATVHLKGKQRADKVKGRRAGGIVVIEQAIELYQQSI